MAPFFFAGDLIFEALKTQKKTDRRGTKRGSFIDNSIITLLHGRHFLIDLQPLGMVGSKFGDCHGMLNHFQHAVMIAICCFFVTGFWSARHKNST
jgi:hypothetical protein